MGISCKINLHTPPEGVFSSGKIVTGEINYTLNENTAFKRITLAFKGKGKIRVIRYGRRRDTIINLNKERYVEIKQIILDKHKEDSVTLNRGSYYVPFQFKLPEKLPPSADIRRKKRLHLNTYSMKYKLIYYVTIKFERSGFLTCPKRFRKELQLISDITPTLPRDPLMYGERKTLFHLFSSADSVVNVKTTILDSVVRVGDNVHIKYEVSNNSRVVVPAVKTKIVEMVTPKKKGKYLTFKKKLAGTAVSKISVQKGGTHQSFVDIKVPDDALTIDSCELLTRNYTVIFTVALPLPHIDFHLKIPIEVRPKNYETGKQIEKDVPPSYWDVMHEK